MTRVGEGNYVYRGFMGKLYGNSHLKDLGVIGRVILQRILLKLFGRAWTRLMWLRIGIGSEVNVAQDMDR